MAAAGGLPGFLGPRLLRGSGEVETASIAATGVVALYFSAHWCPPCREFTPLFAKVYRRCKEQGKSFEVVFVSSDKDEAGFREYFATMPWCAVPFADRVRQQTLSTVFGVRGIPSVVLLSGSGTLLDGNARSKVMMPAFPSTLPRVKDVEGDVGALPAEPMMLEVRYCGQSYEVECDPQEDWELLRMQIYSVTGVPAEQQRLFGLGVAEGPLSQSVPLARALALGLHTQKGSGWPAANVPDAARSASTAFNDDAVGAGHHRGCMNSPQAWSAKKDDKDPWYQMDLGEVKKVVGVVLQPRADNPQWVTKIKVSFASTAAGPFEFVGGGAEFPGTGGFMESQKRVIFHDAVMARFVRVHPVGFNSHCSLRADVLLGGDARDRPPTVVVLGNFSAEDPFEAAGDAVQGAAANDPNAKMMEEQHLAFLQAKLSQLHQRLQSQVGDLKRVQGYEDRALQHQALDQIPVCALDEAVSAAGGADKEGYELAFMRQLLKWFKRSFFTWTNSPPCEHCGSTDTKTAGTTAATPQEQAHGAGNVEVAQCSTCGLQTRFPRYNDPAKLLETRTGRCGEWANCFTLVCRALGYEARWVHDFTDHVWTEVYSDSLGRWVHADSCEAALDCPLMYEQGWGKKLTYCVSFARDGVCDSSRRYTRKFQEMLMRRTEFPEEQLARAVAAIGEFALDRSVVGLPPATMEQRRAALARRADREAQELASTVTATGASLKEGETVGRTSGDKEWREQRGELGASDAARAQAIACSETGVGQGSSATTSATVPGNWIQSASNHSLKDGVLTADLRRRDGSLNCGCTVRVEPGTFYENDDGNFKVAYREPRPAAAATPPATCTVGAPTPPPAAAPAPAAAPPGAPAPAPGPQRPSSAASTASKEDMQATIKAKFAELVASGKSPSEAAALAIKLSRPPSRASNA